MWRLLRGKKRPERESGTDEGRESPLGPAAPTQPDAAPAEQTASPDPADQPGGEPSAARPARATPASPVSPDPGIDVVVQARLDQVGAGIAPEQNEDDLPEPPREHTPLSREDVVADALDRWSHRITGGTWEPSFLTQMRGGSTVLDLSHSHPSGLAQLLAGRGPTRLSSLVREVGALADARAHARAIREIAERHAEEVGLTTCHLGIGEATWTPPGGGAPIHAPVLVRPITLRLRGNAREDVDLEMDATADLNPVLLRALREAGVAVDARALLATTDGPHGFDPTPVLDAFRALGQPLPGFRITYALVVGNLMDAAGSVAEDLRQDEADWASSDLVAALAGDEEARTALAEQSAPEPSVEESELVAAVDPEHREALERILAGQDLAVATAPGIAPLDLVVDLAEELTAHGRSVLIVSQRRRNLSALVDLARTRGIEELVFDLSPDPALQRNASASLLRSLRQAGSHSLSEVDDAPEELRTSREILTGHVEAMHRVQQPWNASAHEAISALAALTRRRPAPRTSVRLGADVAAQMVGEQRESYAASLREAAELGVLSSGPEETAWYGAPISTATQASRAEELVDELLESVLPQLQSVSESTGPSIDLRPARTLRDLTARLALLEQVGTVLNTFQPAVFATELGDLVAATGDKRWRAEHGVTLGWGIRRRLRRQAAGLQRPAALAPDLHRELTTARGVQEQWRRQLQERADAPAQGPADAPEQPAASAASRDQRTPSMPENLEQVRAILASAQKDLDELGVLLAGTPAGTDLDGTDLDVLRERCEALAADRADLETLPRRTELLRRLEFDGLGELVEDLRERRVPGAQVGDELELAWWRSVLELIAAAEPTISQYDGTSLSQVAERFRRLDAEHLAGAAARVHAAADEARVSTMKTYPDTSRAAIGELARASTVSVRDLAAKYEDILFRARPAWLASPYLVPQVIPRGRHFDVVIIADGGSLPTAAALPAIVRSRTTVVVGDPLEYSGDDAPSLLDDMLRIAPHVEVHRDPHPAREGLRPFAQRRALVGEVVSVPSPIPPEPDLLVRVEHGRGPVTEGMEYVESTEAELRRVTDLVIEHARSRPERSLAVLTFTEEHARRLMERIMHTVSVIPALRSFFDPSAGEYFTVVPAAQASSVVRDDVIVSVGFGKTPHGRLLHRFGPLSEDAGRKALATIITRARGRTTVVSSIDVEDLDPSRLRTDGARDLRALLWVMRGGQDEAVTSHVAMLSGSGEQTPAPPAPAPGVQKPAQQEPPAEEPAAEDASAPAEELSDEDVDAAIEAALARKAAAGAADDEPPAEEPAEDQTTAAAEESPEASDAELEETAAMDAVPEDAEDRGTVEVTAEQDVSQPLDAPQDADAPEAPVESLAPSELETDALLRDLADRLWRLGLQVESDFGLTSDRIELALGHPDLPGRLLVAVDTDGARYVQTTSQRDRDRLRAERLEKAGWATERVWSWALFMDPDGEAERIRRAVERTARLVQHEETSGSPSGVGTIRHRLPRPQIAAGHPLSFYSSEDFDAVVEYICSDGRARLEEHLATEVRSFLGFEKRSVLLDVSVSSAIRRYQERQ